MQLEEIARHLPALFSALLIGILFVQSGLDKVFDWNGNLEWLTGHFSKTVLAGMVPMLLATITVLELVTGILSLIGILYLVIAGTTGLIFYASVVGALSITGLFFGQRVAKDYPGAAVLVPYFVLVLILMYLTNPYTK